MRGDRTITFTAYYDRATDVNFLLTATVQNQSYVLYMSGGREGKGQRGSNTNKVSVLLISNVNLSNSNRYHPVHT